MMDTSMLTVNSLLGYSFLFMLNLSLGFYMLVCGRWLLFYFLGLWLCCSLLALGLSLLLFFTCSFLVLLLFTLMLCASCRLLAL